MAQGVEVNQGSTWLQSSEVNQGPKSTRVWPIEFDKGSRSAWGAEGGSMFALDMEKSLPVQVNGCCVHACAQSQSLLPCGKPRCTD